jgi:hypothetical protein
VLKGSCWTFLKDETSSGIVPGEVVEAVKNGPQGTEVGIPLAYQSADPFHSELFGLVLEPLHNHSHDIFI